MPGDCYVPSTKGKVSVRTKEEVARPKKKKSYKIPEFEDPTVLSDDTSGIVLICRRKKRNSNLLMKSQEVGKCNILYPYGQYFSLWSTPYSSRLKNTLIFSVPRFQTPLTTRSGCSILPRPRSARGRTSRRSWASSAPSRRRRTSCSRRRSRDGARRAFQSVLRHTWRS